MFSLNKNKHINVNKFFQKLSKEKITNIYQNLTALMSKTVMTLFIKSFEL